MTIRDYLRTEYYDLFSDAATLDRRLLREAGAERAAILRQIWARDNEHERLEGLYEFPRTPREAHLLFSHDRRRIIDSFQWIVRQAPFPDPIVDVGCGTGTLLRFLALQQQDVKLIGFDRQPNLIAVGQSMSAVGPNVELNIGDFTKLDLTEPAGTILSICGIECLEQPDACVADDEAVLAGTIPVRFTHFAQERIAPVLRNWRNQIVTGGRLLLMARLSNLPLIAATIREAAASGFIIEFERSGRLRSGSERFPAITFIAAEPCAPDLAPISAWA